MTKQQQDTINALIGASLPFIVGEWRGMNVETIKYTDKKTGRAAEFSFINHTLETLGARCVPVSAREDLRKGETPDLVTRPFKKGDRIIVVIRDMKQERGSTVIRASEVKSLEAIGGEQKAA